MPIYLELRLPPRRLNPRVAGEDGFACLDAGRQISPAKPCFQAPMSYGWRGRGGGRGTRARHGWPSLVGGRPAEIRSGPHVLTESDNLAIKGIAATARAQRGRQCITFPEEHKAGLDRLSATKMREGLRSPNLKPGLNGLITRNNCRAALRPRNTILVSSCTYNEIGQHQ